MIIAKKISMAIGLSALSLAGIFLTVPAQNLLYAFTGSSDRVHPQAGVIGGERGSPYGTTDQGRTFVDGKTSKALLSYPKFLRVSEMKTMEEAIRAKTASEEELLKRPGVTGVDVGEGVGGRPIIRIYVVDRTKAVAEGTLPNEINGVPVEIVERRFHIH